VIDVLIQRIREEFDESPPGLQITVEEGVRFWALDAETCAEVLVALHETGFPHPNAGRPLSSRAGHLDNMEWTGSLS